MGSRENMGTVVFLGSFDPPTNGHLHLISEALSHGASEVVMVPAYQNPWKSGQTSYQDRLEMCRSLIPLYGPGKLVVSRIEGDIAKEGNPSSVPSYFTLRCLKEEFGDFRILTTNETLPEIKKWWKGEEILRNYEFMIFSTSRLGEIIRGGMEILDLPVSSSIVRERLGNGQPCPEYLPFPVLEYINKNNLYEKVSNHNRPSE